MGRNCYICRLLEFVAARISRIQFAQRYVMYIYGVRITFVLFTPVPETGCPMWHAGLTLTFTFPVAVSFWAQARQRSFFRPQIFSVNSSVRHVSCMLAKPLSSGTLVLTKTALYHWTLMRLERKGEKTRPEPSEFDFCAPPDFSSHVKSCLRFGKGEVCVLYRVNGPWFARDKKQFIITLQFFFSFPKMWQCFLFIAEPPRVYLVEPNLLDIF